MTMGEVRDVEDTAAASLIRCGHVTAAEAKEDNTDEAQRNKPAAGKGKAKDRS